MWHPIFQQNRDYVVEAMDVYIEHLTKFRDSLKNREDIILRDIIANANKIRSVLENENHSLIRSKETNFKLYKK